MPDATIAQFRTEGQPAFPVTNEEKDNSSGSQPDEKPEVDTTQSTEGGENTPVVPEKDIPFHEHPRWKERDEDWKRRFNEQEARHQEDMKKLREEFSQKREANAENTEIPPWFGGTQEQWDQFRAYEDKRLKDAQDRAIAQLKGEQEQMSKLEREATEFFRSEVAAIESDKELNPDGAKIDTNRLLKIAVDNELIDLKGRWNYRAAYRIYRATAPAPVDTKKRKELAGATTSETKAETPAKPYKTSNDFKFKRPW